jgi:4-hydroxymandelate oxidase
MSSGNEELVNLYDFEARARERLSAMAYAYYASGANDEITLRENHAAYDRIALRYHVLRDVSQRSLSTTVLGEPVSMPILIAPMAFQGMAHPEGDVATARATASAGTIMVLSTLSNASIEEVVASTAAPLWFQLYVYRDREATRELVQRVERAGYRALMLTVDAPVLGRREADVRNRFQLPDGLMAKNLVPAGMETLPSVVADSGLSAYFASLLDPSLTWSNIEWLRSITSLPLLVKGIVREDDAARAVDCGAAAVVVSNHGGRQLDTAPATIDVLAEVVEAVAGRAEVLIDGGIRRGTDVVKALALGARAVMLGRPVLWGLAVDGEQGVSTVLSLLRNELDTALALCGCASLADLGPDLLRWPGIGARLDARKA